MLWVEEVNCVLEFVFVCDCEWVLLEMFGVCFVGGMEFYYIMVIVKDVVDVKMICDVVMEVYFIYCYEVENIFVKEFLLFL